uniref:ATP synthase F0 subunit 8 n=1 Tax=Semibalanus balanoides TaxID=94630 RepID=A0A3G1V8X2_SEMBA|nr:ATP synthase F0 subunit 8 [Semibalanus balanoides]AYJ83651.1 ATP synthase F0 subunit 8 [Semibalanus balanoides]AYJ83664.1 ATP synthase F0 subunit 8 [Semibalanus balanoides]AYJ83677.1 ATP synthase F0 subunit 8 [Semibalanus balanoides]QNS22929.1 ATP synthase F0 subunit 8 [Semibalanus balanoides]
MPHMAPIMWALIMLMTFSMILILLSMIYFTSSPLTPDSQKVSKKIYSSSWAW